jgi:hypothetical protein
MAISMYYDCVRRNFWVSLLGVFGHIIQAIGG